MSDLDRAKALQLQMQMRSRSRTDTGAQPSALREFLQGPAAGFVDEIEAGARALMPGIAAPGVEGGATFGERYRSARDDIREAQEQFQEENPGTALGLNIAGGLVGGLATGGTAAATAGGRAIASGLARLPWWQRLLAASGAGAGTGAAGGAVAGAGEAETLADVPEAAAEGARTGAAVGAALGPVGEVFATPVQWARNRLSRLMSPEAMAQRRGRRVLAEADLTPEAARRAMEENPGSVLADIAEAPRAELEALSQMPGTTGQRAEELMTARAQGAGEDIQGMFGRGRRFEILDELKAERSQSAAPLYRAAYARPTPMSEELERLWSLPTIQNIWRSRRMKTAAQEIADSEGLPFDPRMFDTEQPSTMGWDYLVRGMDRLIEARKRTDPAGVPPLAKLRREIMNEVRTQNPTLGEARSVWAGTQQFEEAMEEGSKFFRMSADELADTVRGMDDVQRDAFREGVNQAVKDQLEKKPDASDVTALFKRPGMWAKVRTLFDNDVEFDEFKTRIEQLSEQQQTRRRVGAALSPTARRSGRMADIEADLTRPGESVRNIVGDKLTVGVPGREAARNRLGDVLIGAPESLETLTRPIPIAPTRGAGLVPLGAVAPVAPAIGAAIYPPEER